MSSVRVVPLHVNCRRCGEEITIPEEELPKEPLEAAAFFSRIVQLAERAHVCTCSCTFDEVGRMVERSTGCPIAAHAAVA